MAKTIVLTRQELYEIVWRTPVSTLAKELGMSDVGIAKICKRMNIPKPGLGYWAKIAHGHKMARPPLPVGDGEPSKPIEFVVKDEVPKPAPVELGEVFQTELERIRQIHVPPLKSEMKMVKNPLLLDLKKLKPEPYRPWEGWIRTHRHSFVWFNIPKESLERSLLLLDGFVGASELCGLRLDTPREGRARFRVFEAEINIAIREKARQVEIIPKPRPQGVYSPVGESTMAHVSLGRMSFTIMDSSYGILERTWTDTKDRKLEDMLKEMIEGMIELAAQKRKILEEHRESELRYVELQKKRWEEERKAQLEKERRDKLWDEVERWAKARQLREYIVARREFEKRKAGDTNLSGETKGWLEWAENVANRIDPIHIDS